MKSKILINLLASLLISSFSFAQDSQALIEYIKEQKSSIEQFIKLSKLKIEITPGKQEPFDPKNKSNFETNKNTDALTTEKLRTFLYDKTKVTLSLTPPYNIARVSFYDYELSELIGQGHFYFNSHQDELPKYTPLKVTYLDGTSRKTDNFISKETILEQIRAKGDDLKTEHLSSLEKLAFKDNTNDEIFFFQSPKPIESIRLRVDIKMAKSNTYRLSNNQKVVTSPYGNFKLDTIVGHKIYFSAPASIKDNCNFEALYKDGKALRYQSSNYSSGLNPEKIQSFEKLMDYYDKAELEVKKGRINNKEMLNQQLVKAMEADPELGAIKSDQVGKYSMTFSGPISELLIKVTDTTTQLQTFEYDYKMNYYESNRDYPTAQDFETEKVGIINQQGEWVIQPTFDQYFRNLNKYFYWRQIDREEVTYRFIPSEKRLEKVDYNLDESEIFADKYVIIDPKTNGPEGVADGSTGKIVVHMKHSFVNFIEGDFWLCRLETGNNYDYGNEGVYKLNGSLLIPFDFKNVEYKSGFFYTKNYSEKMRVAWKRSSLTFTIMKA